MLLKYAQIVVEIDIILNCRLQQLVSNTDVAWKTYILL
jgi:hypothetical protein